jgi:hypothetical protein
MKQFGRVIAEYKCSCPVPLVVAEGDELMVGDRVSEWSGWKWCTGKDGKSSWVPESCIRRTGNTAVAGCDYDATELTVAIGDELVLLKEESGWLWCTTQRGMNGWVPKECVNVVNQ